MIAPHPPSTISLYLPPVTRRDQLLRSWIERESPSHNWQSCVSYRRKTHRRSTNTRIRKAALEFNLLHLSQVIRPSPVQTTTSTHHHPELFH